MVKKRAYCLWSLTYKSGIAYQFFLPKDVTFRCLDENERKQALKKTSRSLL